MNATSFGLVVLAALAPKLLASACSSRSGLLREPRARLALLTGVAAGTPGASYVTQERSRQTPRGSPQSGSSFFTFTQQTPEVVEAMANLLSSHGCDVSLAATGFSAPKNRHEQFTRLPPRSGEETEILTALAAHAVALVAGRHRLPP